MGPNLTLTKRQIKELMATADRRDFLCKNVPKCQKCLHEQVQLVGYAEKPASWKCRMCKHWFEFEP